MCVCVNVVLGEGGVVERLDRGHALATHLCRIPLPQICEGLRVLLATSLRTGEETCLFSGKVIELQENDVEDGMFGGGGSGRWGVRLSFPGSGVMD